MSRANQWFVAGDGISREVITADIQRYLGPDALVRPGVGTGEYQGQSGYWITAYRTLTTQMIQDLRSDSTRWQAERQPGEAGRGAYQDSRTHAARQHWGPTKPYDHPTESYESSRPPQSRPAEYGSSRYPPSESSHYTTSPTVPYGSSHLSYSSNTKATVPRTTPADPYYPPPGGRDFPVGSSYTSYSVAAPADPYGRQTAPPTQQYAPPSATPAPGYYIASDGHQYPVAQQPASRNPQPGASQRY